MAKQRPARLRALDRARVYVGVKEQPAGSNRGHFIDRWNLAACGRVGVYWCMSFVHGMFLEAGFSLPGGASVGNFLAEARRHGWIVKRPRKGDVACFEFNEGAYAYDDHTGLVKRVLALRWKDGRFTGWVELYEGNTTEDGKTGSQSNGGCVAVKRRWVRGIGATFVRVP